MAVPELVHMAGMGLLTSVVAPALILLGRRARRLPSITWPAGLILAVFVLFHAAVMLWMEAWEPPRPAHLLLDALLLAGAVAFWLPVLGPAPGRLDDLGRCMYLFLATMSLDLPAVILVARGDAAGGLAMIVAMLPIGLAAVGLTWRVLQAEEAEVRRIELRESLIREVPYADS